MFVIGIIVWVSAIKHSYITLGLTLGLAAIGLLIYLIAKGSEWKEERRAAEDDRKAEAAARLQHHREEQQGYSIQMIVLGKQSIGLFESMPKYLNIAEEWLNQAEVDFADGAFAPFWDSIEKAAYTLAYIDKDIRQINYNSSYYIELIKKYEDTPP
jgi:hypothetical protein